MTKFKEKNKREICDEIDLIIADEDKKVEYKYIFVHLDNALANNKLWRDFNDLWNDYYSCKTKNRIIRHLEKDFWNLIYKIPFKVIFIHGFVIDEDEELLANTVYDNTNKRILLRLIGLVQEVVELEDDNSKGSELRRAGVLKILKDMIDYCHIPVAKSLFLNSTNSKNKEEQYAALEGLENYYDVSEDEIEDDLIKILDDIKNETNDSTVASTCLQIQINAGIIDEMTAVCAMDDWKDEHYH